MKAKVVIILLLTIFTSGLSGQASDFVAFDKQQTISSLDATSPTHTVTEKGDHYLQAEYQFPGARRSQRSHDGTTYDFLHIKGFNKMAYPGQPALPAHNDIITLPRDARASIMILEAKYEEYSGYRIHPA
mgnify:CR=1 FL=1